jgi:hypothetical protein
MVFATWYDLRTSYGRTIRSKHTRNGQTTYKNNWNDAEEPRWLHHLGLDQV